jgi:hypothetical protein
MTSAPLTGDTVIKPDTIRSLHRRSQTLLDRVVQLSRDVEAEFGRDDDRTIFAKNANCELLELTNMLTRR